MSGAHDDERAEDGETDGGGEKPMLVAAHAEQIGPARDRSGPEP